MRNLRCGIPIVWPSGGGEALGARYVVSLELTCIYRVTDRVVMFHIKAVRLRHHQTLETHINHTIALVAVKAALGAGLALGFAAAPHGAADDLRRRTGRHDVDNGPSATHRTTSVGQQGVHPSAGREAQ